jgi:ATP-dependent Clp protease ATP-binding subunit ClpA
VGSFDEAFLSRIHLQLGYDPLDGHARSKIWENHFRELSENYEEQGQEFRYEWNAKEYILNSTEVKDLQWNGREIRNGMYLTVI